MTRTVRFGRRSVELSHPDKVYFPGQGFTKGDVFDYYQTVAPHLLPHTRRRPLSLQRFPDGIAGEGFYQKTVPHSFPDWISRVGVRLKDGSRQDQVTADSRSVLAYLSQEGVVTMHVWPSRAPHLSEPDRMIFDLDPSDDQPFAVVREAAAALRERLASVGLVPHLMLTGSSGAHVWVPLRRGPDFGTVRSFAATVAESLAEERPAELTTKIRKDSREGRLFLDVARNAWGQTAVAPYMLRALPGAPVSAPLEWAELPDTEESGRFTITTMPRRLAQKDDPWKGMGRHAADLGHARTEWRRRYG